MDIAKAHKYVSLELIVLYWPYNPIVGGQAVFGSQRIASLVCGHRCLTQDYQLTRSSRWLVAQLFDECAE